MRYLIISLILLASNAYAGTQEKVAALMKAQGLDEILESQFVTMQAEGIKQADQMVKQTISEFALPKEFEEKMAVATKKYVQAIHSSISTKEIVSIWSQAYGSKFTSNELDALLKYYNSPLGKKDVAVTKQAFPAFTEYLLQKTSGEAERAFSEYSSSLKAIVEECACKK